MTEPTFEERARAVELAENDGWPRIDIPKVINLDLPRFPTNLLPSVLGRMAEQTAGAIQAPIDIAGMIVLPVAGSTLAGKVRFVGRAEHREHAMLWTLVAAPTSERKTPVFERLREPLKEVQGGLIEQSSVDDEIRTTKLEMVQTQVEALKKAANKAASDTGATTMTPAAEVELSTLIRQRRELEKPLPGPTDWVTSPTPEGLQRVMGTNHGRVAVFTDEGGIVGTLAGRYSGKDGADMDPFLSGYVGSPLRSPRAGSDRPYVDAAHLTMGLAVQPSVLDDLAAVKGADERGLIGRFLFSISSSLVGTRMYDEATPIEVDVASRYTTALKDWAVWNGNPDGTYVHVDMDQQAYRAYQKFHDDIEIRQREGQDLHQNYTVSKIAGTTMRLAGLFHCFDLGRAEALRTKIAEDPMMRAIEMTKDYFIPHGLAVAEHFKAAGPQGIEARILSWIKSKGHREFGFRDLNRALAGKRGSVQKADDLLDPLEMLIDAGYLREVENARKGSRSFEVNPGLFEEEQ